MSNRRKKLIELANALFQAKDASASLTTPSETPSGTSDARLERIHEHVTEDAHAAVEELEAEVSREQGERK